MAKGYSQVAMASGTRKEVPPAGTCASQDSRKTRQPPLPVCTRVLVTAARVKLPTVTSSYRARDYAGAVTAIGRIASSLTRLRFIFRDPKTIDMLLSVSRRAAKGFLQRSRQGGKGGGV